MVDLATRAYRGCLALRVGSLTLRAYARAQVVDVMYLSTECFLCETVSYLAGQGYGLVGLSPI